MARKTRSTKAVVKADPRPADPPVGVAPKARGRKAARIFLMVAGGLAAPCLALAAFFLSGSGGSDKPARPPATQAGRVSGTPASGSPRPSGTAVAAPTTTTTAPAPLTAPRDPFVPLINATPATPGK